MKRIYIAFALIAAALCVGAGEMGYVAAKADIFISKIERADRLMKNSDFEEALLLCEKTEEEWEQSVGVVDMLLIHDYVDEIGISITKMSAFAKEDTVDIYFAVSAQAKKELASVKASEYPYIENIL